LKRKTTIPNTISAVLGAIGLDYALGLEESIRSLVVYLIPALIFIASYLITLLISLTGMGITSRFSKSSSQDARDEMINQLSDPYVSVDRKKQISKEYNDMSETVLAMKTGKFKLINTAHKKFYNNADETFKKSFDDIDQKVIRSEVENIRDKNDGPV
jgi:hypothetical protein